MVGVGVGSGTMRIGSRWIQGQQGWVELDVGVWKMMVIEVCVVYNLAGLNQKYAFICLST